MVCPPVWSAASGVVVRTGSGRMRFDPNDTLFAAVYVLGVLYALFVGVYYALEDYRRNKR